MYDTAWLPKPGDFDYGVLCVCGAVMVAANCSWVDCINPYCTINRIRRTR